MAEAGIIKPLTPTQPTPPANPSQSSAQAPATQADTQKATSITQRIKSQNPNGVNLDKLPDVVSQNALSIGVSQDKVPMMVDLVKKQLGVK